MGRLFPRKWPRSHQVFAPMVRARDCCRTSGTADETKECCESSWNSHGVRFTRPHEVVCHMKDLPGFSHDRRILCCWHRVINSQVTWYNASLTRSCCSVVIEPWQPVRVLGIPEWWWHMLITILDEPSSWRHPTRRREVDVSASWVSN